MTANRARLSSLAILLIAAASLGAEESSKAADQKRVLVSPNLLGPLYGYYNANVEFQMDENLTIELEPGYFNIASIPIFGPMIASENVHLWFAYCKLGANWYTKGGLSGLFAGGYAKGAYFDIGPNDNSVGAGAIGLGAKIGYRWTGTWASLAMGSYYERNFPFTSISYEGSSEFEFFSSSVSGGLPGFYLLFSFVL